MNEGAVALKVNAAAEGFREAAGPSDFPSVIVRTLPAFRYDSRALRL